MSSVADKKYLLSYSKKISIIGGKLISDEPQVTPTTDDLQEQAYKHLRLAYSSILSNPFENIIIFSGAGTSISAGGKSMVQLWEEAKSKLTETTLKTLYSQIKLQYPVDDNEKDLEKLLSQMQKAIEFSSNATSLQGNLDKIKKIIKDACKSIKISQDSPHSELLNKLTARKSKYSRVKVFTLNYDTLFEQAAIAAKYIVIDGFSFSFPRFFDGSFYDYDILIRDSNKLSRVNNYVKKVFHLYKPHGSINWEKQVDGAISVSQECEDPLMIYPNAEKYEHTYEQPFFEMTSRFQRYLRADNTLLICIGFSFNDKHFCNMITEACISNPSLTLIVVLPDFEKPKGLEKIRELTKTQNNIALVAEKFEDFVKHFPYPEEYGYERNNAPEPKQT